MTDEKTSPAAPAAAAPLELDQLGPAAAAADQAGTVPPGTSARDVADAGLPPTNKILEMLLAPAFAILAPNWRVTKDETEQLALAYGAVVDKYFPDLRAGPELVAVLVTMTVFGPRVMTKTPAKLETKKPAAPADKKPRDDEPVDPPKD